MKQLFDFNGNEIKIGSKIRFHGNDYMSPDVGTVTKLVDGTEVWARWESDGREQFLHAGEDSFTVMVDTSSPTKEICVILHTVHGDVRTTYPAAMIEDAMNQFRTYMLASQKVTMSSGDL